MSGTEFYDQLKQKNNFRNEIFNSNIVLHQHDIQNFKSLRFYNCVFDRRLNLKDINSNVLSISFIDCTFNYGVEIKECNFRTLQLTAIKTIKYLEISDLNLQELKLNSNIELETNIIISNITISNLGDFSKLKINKGSFKAGINLFNSRDNFLPEISFNNSVFHNFEWSGNFGNLRFENVRISESSLFTNCSFNMAYFNKSDFGKKVIFNTCIFNSNVSFKECGNFSETKFYIQICTFKSNSFFSEANLNYFNITDSTFESRVSFDKLNVNSIRLHLITFMKNAYFDELQIKNINKNKYINSINQFEAKDLRRTLRIIKQELQKSDNKIDYNRFRAYELAAYYNELKWFGNFKDKFILGATKVATGFDHSWRRALVFTLLIGFSLYALFFVSENYMLQRDFSQWQEFLSGYFRFLIVTDFYNPLAEGRTYIDNTNTIGWLIFIFGKIVIAFGIYEMIQAFRKFKA